MKSLHIAIVSLFVRPVIGFAIRNIRKFRMKFFHVMQSEFMRNKVVSHIIPRRHSVELKFI